jgi:hypothetical protein
MLVAWRWQLEITINGGSGNLWLTDMIFSGSGSDNYGSRRQLYGGYIEAIGGEGSAKERIEERTGGCDGRKKQCKELKGGRRAEIVELSGHLPRRVACCEI